MTTHPRPVPLSAEQAQDLQAAAVEALAVLRDLLRDRATGQHYSRVNAACWALSTALGDLRRESRDNPPAAG